MLRMRSGPTNGQPLDRTSDLSGVDDAAATRTVLVGVDLGMGHSFDPTLDELAQLAESAGDEPVARLVARRKAPDAALFVGSGKADEIKALVAEHRASGVRLIRR
jgi:GTP-binding protein HflX